MAHRSSVLQKKIVFSTFHGPHHTLYIIFIEYDTIHRELDPSTTVIKKNHSLRCGHRPMWWRIFIWDSIFPGWFKFKKKNLRRTTTYPYHQYWLPHCMKHTCYGVILDVNYWMNGLEMREREKGGRFIYFSSMCISAGLCFKKMDGTVKYNILG